jgi:hypothetical protein
MALPLPRSIDTLIVGMQRPLSPMDVLLTSTGNGPSALILSYLLHGNIPVYNTSSPHLDPLLHQKLKNSPDLLHLDVDALTDHFSASRFSYSTRGLPINVLLDTLVRPLGETDSVENRSCVTWKFAPERAISHAVLGNTNRPGGQWVDNPVKASWDIGTLSYAGMLSLPGYSFDEHYLRTHGKSMPAYMRPSRRLVADYLAAYPSQAGIDDTLYCGQKLFGITRTTDGFYVSSHHLRCRHLVLATGVFSELIPPPPLLQPLVGLPAPTNTYSPEPLLVIGSGFSAADVIISAHPLQKIIHIFKWAPATNPSPLRACHQQAYPEYAHVYKRMKIAAISSSTLKDGRPKMRRSSSTVDDSRDWNSMYEGLPNTTIIDVEVERETATVMLQANNGVRFLRRISCLAYVVGRRGSLDYLDRDLRKEVWPEADDNAMLSGRSLREKANDNLEVAHDVFIIGSLTGDSLIRFAYGGCTFAAGKIMSTPETLGRNKALNVGCCLSATRSPHIKAMDGLDGHECSPILAGASHYSLREAEVAV